MQVIVYHNIQTNSYSAVKLCLNRMLFCNIFIHYSHFQSKQNNKSQSRQHICLSPHNPFCFLRLLRWPPPCFPIRLLISAKSVPPPDIPPASSPERSCFSHVNPNILRFISTKSGKNRINSLNTPMKVCIFAQFPIAFAPGSQYTTAAVAVFCCADAAN